MERARQSLRDTRRTRHVRLVRYGSAHRAAVCLGACWALGAFECAAYFSKLVVARVILRALHEVAGISMTCVAARVGSGCGAHSPR
jgi:hypothetical protein